MIKSKYSELILEKCLKARSASPIRPASASSEKTVGKDIKIKYFKKIMTGQVVDVIWDIPEYVEAMKEKVPEGSKITVHTQIKTRIIRELW